MGSQVPTPRSSREASNRSETLLTVICPGLLGPVPRTLPPPSALSMLDVVVARARRGPSPGVDADSVLLGAFGLPATLNGEMPNASICLWGEFAHERPAGAWLHATPVHLRADRDRLLLFTGSSISPTREESGALVDHFNAHFQADGLRLIAPHPQRWYLSAQPAIEVAGDPPERLLGRAIPATAPAGGEAGRWLRLMNEVQMLFFAHPVNRAREQAGRPPISGVWIWGGGPMPDAAMIPPDRPSRVVGDSVLTLGVARWAQVQHATLDEWTGELQDAAGSSLVVWDRVKMALNERDPGAWAESLVALDARLAQVRGGISRGRCEVTLVDPDHGIRFVLDRSAQRRFWRTGRLATRWMSV